MLDQYVSYGRFEPFLPRQILKRFEQEAVRFQIGDAGGAQIQEHHLQRSSAGRYYGNYQSKGKLPLQRRASLGTSFRSM
jgi:hypothetical protein